MASKEKKTQYEIEQEKKEAKRAKIEAKRKAKREAMLDKDMNRIQAFFYDEQNENIVGIMKEAGSYIGVAVVGFLYWAFLLFMVSMFLVNTWKPVLTQFLYMDILIYAGILTLITLAVHAYRRIKDKKK